MQRLREQQRRLAALISEPGGATNGADELSLVTPADAAAARERLEAYTHGYPARIFEALDEAYPTVRHLVGDSAFAELARRYAPRAPAGIYSLSDIGAALPDVLRSDPVAQRFPFLSDLAALEWRVVRAFHAYEKAPFDVASVSGWSLDAWQGARLELQPSVAIVRSQWPLLDLWNLRETPIADIDLDLVGRAQDVLVTREGYAVRCDLVDPAQAMVLLALLEGATLGDALERLASTSDDVADVSAWFAAWAARGLIASCVAG